MGTDTELIKWIAQQPINVYQESHAVKIRLDQFNMIFESRIITVCKDDVSAIAG